MKKIIKLLKSDSTYLLIIIHALLFWVYYWITYGIAQFVVYLFKKFKVIEFIKESGLLSVFEDKSFLFMIIFGVLVTIISNVIRCVIEHKREKEAADTEEEI